MRKPPRPPPPKPFAYSSERRPRTSALSAVEGVKLSPKLLTRRSAPNLAGDANVGKLILLDDTENPSDQSSSVPCAADSNVSTVTVVVPKVSIAHVICIIIWPCLKRTGNNQIQELDWLKWILTAV